MNGQTSDEESALWLRNMDSRPTVAGIAQSISEDADYYDGQIPENNALAWYAWMSGLVEWGRLSGTDFEKLRKLLPEIKVDQSLRKFLEPREPDLDRLAILESFDAIFEDLKKKLELDAKSFGGTLPELHNVAWTAYLAGPLEFGVLLQKHFAYFCDHFLPNSHENPEDDPAYGVIVGPRSSMSKELNA